MEPFNSKVGFALVLLLGIFFGSFGLVQATSTFIVQQGGTGSTTLTGILKGNGTNPIQTAIPGTDYQLPLSLPLSIANGGTATSSAVTNGVYYYNGTNAEADSLLTFNGSQLAVGGTTNGNVKINTSNGGYNFGINAPDATNNVAQILFSSSALRTFQISNGGTGGLATIFGNTNRSTGVGTNFVGINATSTPGALLSIAGSAGGTTPLFMLSTSTATFATSTAFEIDNNGNASIQNGGSLNMSTSGSTNYLTANSGNFNFASQNNTTGNIFSVGQNTVLFTINGQGTPKYNFAGTSGGSAPLITTAITITNTSGVATELNVSPTINNSSTAGYTALSIRPTETALGSGNHILLNIGTSTAPDLFDVTNLGVASSTGLNVTGNEVVTGSVTWPAITGTQCLHAINGLVSGTGSDCGAGTVGSGTTGQFPYYAANGTALTATSSLFLAAQGFVGVGTSTPLEPLVVEGSQNALAAIDTTVANAAGYIQFSRQQSNRGFVGFENTSASAFTTNGLANAFVIRSSAALELIAGGNNALIGETIASNGNVGIGTTSPFANLSITSAGQLSSSAYLFDVASTTNLDLFHINAQGEIVATDHTSGNTGVVSPTKWLVMPAATSTAIWTGTSTPGVDAAAPNVAPFAGTIRNIRCNSNTFLGVQVTIAGTPISPSYFIASSTVGNEIATANNTFTSGQLIQVNYGTTTTATANAPAYASCTIGVTETP